MLVSDAAAACLQDKASANRRPAYLANLRRALASLERHTGNAHLESITSESLTLWASTAGPHHRRTLLSRASTLYQWAIRRRILTHNPTTEIESVSIDRPEPTILSPGTVAQAGEILLEKRPQFLAWFALCAFYGLRPQEACRIGWEDIDGSTVRVSPRISKVRRIRIVEGIGTGPMWLSIARARGSRLPLSPISARRCIRLLRESFGWPAWPQDCLRHTAATYALAHFQDAAKTALWLGNSSAVLLTHYRALAPSADSQTYWQTPPPTDRRQLAFAFG